MQNVLFELQSIVSHPYTVYINKNYKMTSKFSIYFIVALNEIYLHIYIQSMA